MKIILLALAGLISLDAQVFNAWESGAVQFATQQAIRNAQTCGGYCSPGPANPYGGPVGMIAGMAPMIGSGYGYPVGVSGSRAAQVAGSAAMGAGIGATMGAIVGRDGRSTAIGAAVGATAFGGIAYAMSRRGGGQAVAGPSVGGGNGEFELSNSTRFSVEVYHRNEKGKEKYVGRLGSGDAWAVKAPKPSEAYHGFALIPNQNGGLTSDRLVPMPSGNGWVFVEPDFGRGGGR